MPSGMVGVTFVGRAGNSYRLIPWPTAPTGGLCRPWPVRTLVVPVSRLQALWRFLRQDSSDCSASIQMSDWS